MTTLKAKPARAAKAPVSMKRSNFFMPVSVLAGLQRLAKRRKCTTAQVLRDAAAAELTQNGIKH